MSTKKSLCAVMLITVISGCAAMTPSSRNVTPSYTSSEISIGLDAVIAAPSALAITSVEVTVPQSLQVSEADVFVPIADIVWRGQPEGDRYQQVSAIFQDAAARATGDMTLGRGAIVSLEVTRFHGLTEKARYTVGGNYAMHFLMTVRDAVTGEILDGPRPVVADVRGVGGVRAIAEDNAGRTELVVVTERLADVLRGELTSLVLSAAL